MRFRSAALVLALAAASSWLGAAGAAPASAAVADRVLGVSLPSYHYDASAVTAWERAVGQDVDVLQTFVSWQYDDQPEWSQFPTGRARQITDVGATLEVTWVPSNPARGRNDPAFSLGSIARGEHDAYVRSFAAAVRDFREPVRIRFGHEMNGSWTPYHEANSGNGAGDFVRAWRHLRGVFAAEGATNALWVWSPNVLHPGGTSLAGLYPGDAHVDEVGLDGYSNPAGGCPTPRALFGPTVDEVARLTARPVRIAEVGVATACPGRSAWISSFFDYLDATPQVTGFTWWERAGQGLDYRVATADTEAFRVGAASGSPSPGRVAGLDRYETAASLSRLNWPAGSDVVVLASGADYPDALAAAPAARAFSAPVLLVGRQEAPGSTLDEIRRLGASSAVVVGGPASVSAGVAQQVQALGVDVARVSGADRYETAAELAATIVAAGGTPAEVLVASGTSFADGLVGGAHGAVRGVPLLLTAPGALSPATEAALTRLRPGTITLLGGPAAVSTAVEVQLRGLGSGRVRRLEGADRYATAAAVQQDLRTTAPSVLLASGDDFPDALAAAALGFPLLLARPQCLPGPTEAALRAWGTTSVTGVGGSAALSDAALRGVVCR